MADGSDVNQSSCRTRSVGGRSAVLRTDPSAGQRASLSRSTLSEREAKEEEGARKRDALEPRLEPLGRPPRDPAELPVRLSRSRSSSSSSRRAHAAERRHPAGEVRVEEGALARRARRGEERLERGELRGEEVEEGRLGRGGARRGRRRRGRRGGDGEGRVRVDKGGEAGREEAQELRQLGRRSLAAMKEGAHADESVLCASCKLCVEARRGATF